MRLVESTTQVAGEVQDDAPTRDLATTGAEARAETRTLNFLRDRLKSWSTSTSELPNCNHLELLVAVMSGGIEEPYAIASLPKPLDAEKGRTSCANVYSLSGSKKRKRREIAVGVDGESVSIYNVCL